MNDSFSKFLAAYSDAPQNIKDLIDSEEIGIFVDTLLTNNTPVPPKQKLLVILSNRVLDLLPDSQMISQLEEIGLSQPEKIAQIKNFISLKTAAVTTDNSILESTKTDVANEIAETEAAMEKISPIRTMAGDSKQIGYSSTTEPTYTSTQSAIINETK